MLYLKEANWEDREEEFTFLTQMPQDENGSINPCFGMTQGKFFTQGLPQMIDNAKGIGLPEGYVPATTYFLWENDKIVGKFNLRHRLSEALRNGGGHIGYSIRKDCRGRGLATEGLRMALEKARDIVPEEEIYLHAQLQNLASLRVMEKNGAYIHHQDDTGYYTRIKK